MWVLFPFYTGETEAQTASEWRIQTANPGLFDSKCSALSPVSHGLEDLFSLGTREVRVILHMEAYASHEALLGLTPQLGSKCPQLGPGQHNYSACEG